MQRLTFIQIPFLFLFLLTQFSAASASEKFYYSDKYVQVELVALSQNDLGANVGVEFIIQPAWHVYWQNPGDSGAAPKFQVGEDLLSPLAWPAPERIAVGDLNNYGYSNRVIFPLKLDSPTTLNLEWLVCKIECVPGFADLYFDGNVKKLNNMSLAEISAYPFPKATSDLSLVYQENQSETFVVRLQGLEPSKQSIREVDLFPVDGGVFRTHRPATTIEDNDVLIQMPWTPNSNRNVTGRNAVVVVSTTAGKSAFQMTWPEAKTFQFFWQALILSLIGGFILNVMPCVFPVLSIKVLSLVKYSQNPQAIKKSAWLYSAGVVISFLGLGLLLVLLRLSGQQIGWGFQLQSPVFVGFLMVLFFVMALNFWGVFDWGDILSTKAMQLGQSRFFDSSFGSGVLAVLVASPCTAPFMGTALGFTLLLQPYQSLLVFVFLGLGLALPFLFLSYQPQLLQKLPKPGPWMVTFRKILAVPLLLTVIWLGWVLSFQIPQLTSQAQSSDWTPYSEAVLQQATQEKRPVFIDFTAAWCITCQWNKKSVLSTDAAQELFSKNNVLLVQADWTNRSPEITAKLKTYNRNSVPLYVYIAQDQQTKILPELLTLSMIEELFKPKEISQ